MASESVRVRQRPIRIGWCIRNNNWDDLRQAMRATHTLWGGRFNPLIPVGVVCAERLIRRFRVDVLLNVTDDPEIAGLMKGFGHLPWPLHEPGLFSRPFGQVASNFLDVWHPSKRSRTTYVANIFDILTIRLWGPRQSFCAGALQ